MELIKGWTEFEHQDRSGKSRSVTYRVCRQSPDGGKTVEVRGVGSFQLDDDFDLDNDDAMMILIRSRL